MGLLARFFKGSFPIEYQETLKFRKQIIPWYDIFILQSTEENIVEELSTDKNGNRKKLPKPEKIRERVIDRIKENNDKEVFERIKKKFGWTVDIENGEE